MSGKAALAVLVAMLPLLALGGWLWSRQGVMVWLQDAIRYCF